jgi:MtN3 and saliva related transmembrane protein
MTTDNWVQVLGAASGGLVLLTLSYQVWKQWRDRVVHGVSRWFFVGQTAGSIGFVAYSYLVHNGVFLATNILILASAIAGEAVLLINKKWRAPDR